ncbi:HAD family hydrolase [Ktedonospora formicarum]|uniref:HAD family hydrolase n=1 Tax=Ktedonospora formicarum TaxID=2778364 RepID=A0A8J3MQ75_9CHLR|nr:HAD family hydrolase [Ktedonospora formicarum]GHO42476.1 hypothetical protein KSX_06390 [Ktedonospora formicarum]
MTTLTFWIDVDNTLIDNDRVKQDLFARLQETIGSKLNERFWEIYEEVRADKSVIDIPLTLQRLRDEIPLSEMDETTYKRAHAIFDDYPFDERLYPHTIEALQHLNELGTTVIVSDGDKVFQDNKIHTSGLFQAVQGRVMIYDHKQQHLNEIIERYPADHFVMVDDKPQILHETKKDLGARLTTVFVRQGKYASAPLPDGFAPDISVDSVEALRSYQAEQFLKP